MNSEKKINGYTIVNTILNRGEQIAQEFKSNDPCAFYTMNSLTQYYDSCVDELCNSNLNITPDTAVYELIRKLYKDASFGNLTSEVIANKKYFQKLVDLSLQSRIRFRDRNRGKRCCLLIENQKVMRSLDYLHDKFCESNSQGVYHLITEKLYHELLTTYFQNSIADVDFTYTDKSEKIMTKRLSGF